MTSVACPLLRGKLLPALRVARDAEGLRAAIEGAALRTGSTLGAVAPVDP
jgi:hypothetical protein